MIEAIPVVDLYSPLAANFTVGQWVILNKSGFMPYQYGKLQIIRLSYSSVVVDFYYQKGGKNFIEKDIHIPYEQLVM